jgi:hypothetical protein
MKTCTSCGETKPLDAFSPHPRCEEGRFPTCKACRAARGRADYALNREAILEALRNRRANRRDELVDYERKRSLRRKYGMSPEEYEARVAVQSGCCAICGTAVDRLSVDHCHETGGLRGLLCKMCNVGLGLFRDNPDRLRNAAAYLERWQSLVDRTRLESEQP